jgi:hypothetical protein
MAWTGLTVVGRGLGPKLVWLPLLLLLCSTASEPIAITLLLVPGNRTYMLPIRSDVCDHCHLNNNTNTNIIHKCNNKT